VIAEGALFDVQAFDACTDSSVRCEADRITVKDADVEGPFVVESFEGDVVHVRASGSGEGLVDVTVSMDGETATAFAEVSAQPVIAVTLTPECVGESSPWVAPGVILGMRYLLIGAHGSLGGNLEPPLETTLELIDLDEPGHAHYRTPVEPGALSAVSMFSGSELLQLQVFDAGQVLPELVPRASLRGPTVYFDVEQRVETVRPCVESDLPVHVRSDSSDICLLPTIGGEELVEVTAESGRVLRVSVLATGRCVLSARFEDSSTLVVREFEVESW
jgi:hypothetical protein